MKNKRLMANFLGVLEEKGLITLFIKNIFGYEHLKDFNYIYRMKEERKAIIIDIYDNISSNRFNRYIFSFTHGDYDIKIVEDKNVFVSYINVLEVNDNDNDNKLLKLAYLFKNSDKKMLKYAKSFLDELIIDELEKVIKEPTI